MAEEEQDLQVRIEKGYMLAIGEALKINLKTGGISFNRHMNNRADLLFWQGISSMFKKDMEEAKADAINKSLQERNTGTIEQNLRYQINQLKEQVDDLRHSNSKYKRKLQEAQETIESYKKTISQDRFSGMDL